MHLGMPELVIILVLALFIFGAGKLPEIGSSLGKSIRNFKKAAEAPLGEKPELPAPDTAASGTPQPTSTPEGGVQPTEKTSDGGKTS